MNSLRLIIDVFKFLCIVTAGFMVGFWIYEYQKNEDNTLIEVKSLKDADDTLYPELTIFVLFPFWKQINNQVSLRKNETIYIQYVQYLKGEIDANETYEELSFQNSTINIFDFWYSAAVNVGTLCFLLGVVHFISSLNCFLIICFVALFNFES